MKRILILLTFLLLNVFVFSQSFITLFDNKGRTYDGSRCLNYFKSQFLIGTTYAQFDNLYKINTVLYKINALGVITDSLDFNKLTSHNYALEKMFYNQGKFIIFLTRWRPSDSSVFIVKTDTLFTIEDSISLGNTIQHFSINDVVKISSHNAVIDTFLVLASTSPSKFWGSKVKVFKISSVLLLIDSTSIPISTPVRGVYLHKNKKVLCSNMGKLIWFRADSIRLYGHMYFYSPSDQFHPHLNLRTINDSSYYEGCFMAQAAIDTFFEQFSILKRNSSGITLQTQVFNKINVNYSVSPLCQNFDFTHPDSLWVAIEDPYYYMDNEYDYFPKKIKSIDIHKILYSNGIIIKKSYGGDAFYKVIEVKATNDGGCLVTLLRFNWKVDKTERFDLILLKLDSQGNFPSGIENIEQTPKAKVFPNPATEFLSVETFQSSPSEISLFNANGKLVLTEKWNGKSHYINIIGLQPGLYCYRLITGNEPPQCGKIVITR